MATLTEAGLVMGTAPYMSPEQAQGQVVDARSDIFSLGSILYEAATGVRAFPGDSTIDTLHKILHSEPDPLERRVPDAPLQLQWILRKALAKSPDDRYQSARDLVVDLKALRRDLDSDSSLPTVVSGQVPAAISSRQARSDPPFCGRPSQCAALLGVAALFWTLGRQTAAPVEEAVAPAALTKRRSPAAASSPLRPSHPTASTWSIVESLQGEQSLNLRQVGGAQSLQLIESRPVAYWGMTSIPRAPRWCLESRAMKTPTGSMYQISTLGGSPRKLVTRLDSAPTFSPDGAQDGLDRRQSSGTEPELDHGRQLGWERAWSPGDLRVSRAWWRRSFIRRPSWSPDGRLIATSILNRRRATASPVGGRRCRDRGDRVDRAARVAMVRHGRLAARRETDCWPLPRQQATTTRRSGMVPYPEGRRVS